MLTREEFDRILETVPYCVTNVHGHVVEGVIKWLRPLCVLEIGVAHGYMTCRIARALQENGHGLLYTIDNWTLGTSPQEVARNLERCGVADRVLCFSGTVETARLPQPVQVAIIDANHSVPFPLKDAIFAMRCGAEWIMFHDTAKDFSDAGPKEAVAELKRLGWSAIAVQFDSGWTICHRETPT